MEKLVFSDSYRETTAGLSRLIESIGDPHFEKNLLTYINEICETEQCTVFQLNTGRPIPILSARMHGLKFTDRKSPYLSHYWRSDPLFPEARTAAQSIDPILLRADVETVFNPEIREILYTPVNIGERNLICANVSGMMLALCVPRARQQMGLREKSVGDIFSVASPLLSIIGTHLRISSRNNGVFSALYSQRQIEDCMIASGFGLTKREVEVCARIIFGISSVGIALDLKISEETVATYRKRAYHRLSIGSKHELLQWYFSQWNAMQSNQVPDDMMLS
jgi:DNA-binding CsgD family transcriptional regulator